MLLGENKYIIIIIMIGIFFINGHRGKRITLTKGGGEGGGGVFNIFGGL